MTYQIFSFYRFVKLDDPSYLAKIIAPLAQKWGLRGTIILAKEGINASLSGQETEDPARHFMRELSELSPAFKDLSYRLSYGPDYGFKKFLIKLKPSILSFPHSYAAERLGAQKGLDPAAFHRALLNAETSGWTILDTRNDYEIEAGRFAQARDLKISHFGAFPEAFDKAYGSSGSAKGKFLIYCTGGIRCEKAQAYLEDAGHEVFALEGGILEYLKSQGQGLWDGECFVFDERLGVDSALRPADEQPQT